MSGAVLMGWGFFNVVEGLVDHQLLGLHHVNELAPRAQWVWYDMGFLLLGVVLLATGWVLLREGRFAVGVHRPAVLQDK